MEKSFWSIDPKSVKAVYDEIGCLIGMEYQLDIDTEGMLDDMEFIEVSKSFADNEILRKQFPFELEQDYHQALTNTVTLYKTPRTKEDWHKHYTLKAECASEIAEEYFEKARMYKRKAKETLKSNY